jgi:hypothetical protein
MPMTRFFNQLENQIHKQDLFYLVLRLHLGVVSAPMCGEGESEDEHFQT